MIAETGLAAAVAYLDLNREHLILRSSDDELDAVTNDQVIKVAVRRLRLIAGQQEHPEHEAALRAIRHLQLVCHRRRQEAAA